VRSHAGAADPWEWEALDGWCRLSGLVPMTHRRCGCFISGVLASANSDGDGAVAATVLRLR
jgi:hypothetical protein